MKRLFNRETLDLSSRCSDLDINWPDWEREPCFFGSLRIHCRACREKIYKYFKDIKDIVPNNIYLLPESCEVCGRDRKIQYSEIQLVISFHKKKY